MNRTSNAGRECRACGHLFQFHEARLGSMPRGRCVICTAINVDCPQFVPGLNDDERERVRQVFGDRTRVPRDVVPATGITRETLRAQNDACATDEAHAGQVHGEVVLDADGMPTAVEPSTPTSESIAGVVISTADADRLGLTPEELNHDFPHVSVWDPSTGRMIHP